MAEETIHQEFEEEEEQPMEIENIHLIELKEILISLVKELPTTKRQTYTEKLKKNYGSLEIIYELGKILFQMKSRHQLNYAEIKFEVQYSKAWINFIIKIFKLIEKYPGFIQCGTPLHSLYQNIKILPDVLSEHKEEWENMI